jgi:excisionase family DNA binding protein
MIQNMNEQMQESWTPEQIAVMLHVSVTRIYEAIERGELSAHKAEESYKISQQSMEEFLQDGNIFTDGKKWRAKKR